MLQIVNVFSCYFWCLTVILWCIYQSYFGASLSERFLVFVCHFMVHLSELLWSEFVRAAIFICFSLFLAALNLSIYLSIYLPTSNLITNLSIQSYLYKFFKSSFIIRKNFYIAVLICTVIKNCCIRFTKFTFCP